MAEEETIINLQLSQYEHPGLYLILSDSTELLLTRENIERVTAEMWADPEKIPSSIKEAVEFQRCPFCPLKGDKEFCDALRPTLPLFDILDRYNSFDEVAAIYKGDDEELCHVSYTTMQRALRYVSNLSLMAYCQVGRKYWKYFIGIIPITDTQETANRLYLNMYWAHEGNREAVDQTISRMSKEITITSQNQAARLRLICDNDAFLNAFILTHMLTDILFENKDRKLKESIESFEKSKRQGQKGTP
ncbi:MAG: hypothetical protein JRJ47_04160 [Deltaproteobacteria bacterium]|nr:hypothetical protein [Deltaproteobacteria bacterium]